MIVILTTIHKKKKALAVGNGLLKERLIACYNLCPIQSGYWWKGKILRGGETLMILKTKNNCFKKVETYIKKQSGYEVPEVIALTVNKVNASYLRWVNAEVK